MNTTHKHDEWFPRAAAVLDGSPKLARPDVLAFFRWARLEPDQWTLAEKSACWARLRLYREVLRAAGLRWRPAPVGDGRRGDLEKGLGDERLRAGFVAGRFLLWFPFGHDATAAVRAIEGCKWDPSARAWTLAPSEAAAEAVEGLAGFVLDEQATAAIADLRAMAAETRIASRSAAARMTVDGLAGELRPYQQAGVKYLVEHQRAYLADEMGLGKTVQALAAVQALGAWPCLVATLASCKGGWAQECARWLPGVRVVVWEGRKGDRETGRQGDAEPVFDGERVLHVINYDLLGDRIEELKELGVKAAVFDEIHHLKNGKAKRTKAARMLVGGPKKGVQVRFGLSGTPVMNRPSELLSTLGILGRLDDLGGFWKFAERYCDAKQAAHGWDFRGASNLGELHDRLRGCCFIRRTKEQVLGELPPKIVTRVPVGMSAEGWAEYRSAETDLKGWLAAKAAIDPAWEATVAHLSAEEREFARAARMAEAIERLDGMELLLRLGTLRQVAASGKVGPAKEWVREMCQSRKLVLFGHHRAPLRALQDEFADEFGALLIDGDTPSAKRAGMVRAFANAERRLMLLNLTAGGTGLDGLQHAASDVAFLEFPWTPAGMEQAASRLHRMGQLGTVHEWRLTAPGTVDEELLAVLAAKKTVCGAATDGQRESAAAAARWMASGLSRAGEGRP